MIKAEIAIIGAGVAGSTAAIALASSHNVLLIDREATPGMRIGESLPPAARRILQRLGLLDSFNKHQHLQSQGMESYWGSAQPLVVDQLMNPDGFGWHLDRPTFENFLRTAAISAGAKVMWPAKISSSSYQSKRWLLNTAAEETISADYVIDAGGRQSSFVRQQGVKRQHYDKLIACWVTTRNNSKSRLGLISAVADGWWYSAPIPNERRVIAFQTDSDLVEPAVKKNLDAFKVQAQQCLPIAELFADSSIADLDQNTVHHGVRSSNSSRLETVTGKSWAALGDAALSFDPLSSQGMFNSMATALQLSELIQSGSNIAEQYSHQIENIWRHYRHHHALYYRQEQRWPKEAFWTRRQ